MSNFLADQRPIDETEFNRRACDPATSVVVEACAGSGKTWLLVSRIVRALLAGSAPGEILAITFTRRAAQEMRARLMTDLMTLASADDAAIVTLLTQRGMTNEAARAALVPARSLYERVATARVPPTIETFHGWFWQLAARAPLGAGVPFAPQLIEATDRLRADAWLHFAAALTRTEHAAERSSWERLIDLVGDHVARQLVLEVLAKRAEWWAFAAGDESAAVGRALLPLRAAGNVDPYRRVRDPLFVDAMRTLHELWCSIPRRTAGLDRFCEIARRWLDQPAADPEADFHAICHVLLTKDDTLRQHLLPDKIGPKIAVAADRYAEAHAFAVSWLQTLQSDRLTWRALQLNEAALACGRLLIDIYQRLKTQQQALDFTDLEWHAHRLLADPDHAAYLQARLDARYRHVLLDEFQDTNPLQWQVVQSWLAAYGPADDTDHPDAIDRPRVFIVGDPKQSIYRFRRAEPRVFEAALALLQREFGAVHLRTNVTRRNPQALIDVLNGALPGSNPLYQPQATCSAAQGAFVLLPLAQPPTPPAAVAGLRDVLTSARTEPDRDTHYREGRALANEIAHWVAELHGTWSDVLLLVPRRTHLADYERALRDAGVPFVSDRSGGLLATLEADDLTALLQFLTAPFADLSLAHALRSPIFGASDDDLMQLAAAPGAGWWQRLQAIGSAASPALMRARDLLARWQPLAGVLPVHDLLDRIYFEADLRRRYAEVVPAALHAQVQANLDAFIELALALDAGRYPSLPRFIDELAGMQRHSGDEAPDEGATATADAVRVMTIHGAKGLEAEIVALADAHSRPAVNGPSMLVVWPPDEAAPRHLSLATASQSARDPARAAWFADDDAQCVQEDHNLLYVAATRARRVLIVSGSAPAPDKLSNTWYQRLEAVRALSVEPSANRSFAPPLDLRTVCDFRPAPLAIGTRVMPVEDSEAMRLGRAWHALLEFGDEGLDRVARSHRLSSVERERVAAAATRVRQALPQFFDGVVRAEMDLVTADGELLRVDRLVEHDDALWIIDFKWRVTDVDRPLYEAQVRRYAGVLCEIRSDKRIRMGLVAADGTLIEVQP